MAQHTLILGGAKSGKSALALRLGQALPGRRIFIATAQAGDQEMARRIARHQQSRGELWTTLEEPLELEQALRQSDGPESVMLVDCLTLWLSNLLTQANLDQAEVEQRCRSLVQCLPSLAGRVILVSNELGLGVVPDNPLARLFRDLAGGLNQDLARECELVIMVTAGLGQALKGRLPQLEEE